MQDQPNTTKATWRNQQAKPQTADRPSATRQSDLRYRRETHDLHIIRCHLNTHAEQHKHAHDLGGHRAEQRKAELQTESADVPKFASQGRKKACKIIAVNTKRRPRKASRNNGEKKNAYRKGQNGAKRRSRSGRGRNEHAPADQAASSRKRRD